MGLDVNMYRLITDKDIIEKALKEYSDMAGYSYLENGIFGMSEYEYGTIMYKDNKRIAELFEKYKQHSVNFTLKNYFNLEVLANKYGEYKEFIVDTRERLNCTKYGITDDMRGDLDEDHPHVLDYDTFAVWINTNDEIFVFKQSEIETHDIVDDVLFFENLEYCRKTHKRSIYPSFIGDCWYEDDNSGLSEADTRIIVFANELDEFKKHFEDDSPIQKWSMQQDDIIYLSA